MARFIVDNTDALKDPKYRKTLFWGIVAAVIVFGAFYFFA